MHPNAALIERFYAAFGARDAEAMAACYHPNATFSDPAFGKLAGDRPAMMWRMLTSRASDLVVTASAIQADDSKGSAHWEATYTFAATKRKVHNVIDATFTFKDGLILSHDDVFDFHRWSKQALGAPGYLLGWTSFLQNTVRKRALGELERYIARRS
ncbi:MAG: nuclear transport factor 2 family protein [Myxococcales bacterium]|nr:nuclear transport factor 2 family protein [Myxococcales bacterium]